DLNGPKIADILWTLRPTENNRFLVGTGPDGKVIEVTFNPKDNTYTTRDVADVTEAQAVSVQPLSDGRFLIGTSPTAAVYLAKDGKLLARVVLPADSVFDFLPLPDGAVLVATGNPGKIYKLDVAKFAKAGMGELAEKDKPTDKEKEKDKAKEKPSYKANATDDKTLAEHGLTIFAEVRDRNVRRLARLNDGRIIAGSSPKGNVYSLGAAGGQPLLLQENRDAEVVDLLPDEDGSFYAALVFSPGESSRINRPKNPAAAEDKDDRESRQAFSGRSTVVRFPVDGFPETVVSKSNLAFYRLAQHHGWLLLSAGEQGDLLGYDPVARRSLTFAGSDSAQINDLTRVGDGQFLALRNNAPGLAVLSFTMPAQRVLETKRLDLGSLGELGNIRFARSHGVDLATVKLEARTNNGSDEIEGWSAWTELKAHDGGFSAEGLRGRYLKLRLTLPPAAKDFQLDKATAYHLPQNRRPLLADFRIFPANLGLVPAPEAAPSATTTLGQILFPSPVAPKDDSSGEKRKGSFFNSQVVPQSNAQVIYWSVTDPDGDNLAFTLSIRSETSDTWTDLTVDTRDTYVQFDTGTFPEGLYFTRLTVKEQSPRPEKQRLTYAFETDNLTIDRTPPEITATSVEHRDGRLVISVEGRDAISLLEGAEFQLNNGTRESTEHPADGILDGRAEKFIVEIPDPKTAGATAVEIILYDQNGNNASKRLLLK
ncbi:MAG TPA: hypothetical protein VFJ90_09640, partial [Candidatus Didemnitutus sp.]|nr:hypothetical protein [Candidatus Didemnitutus sp.]